MSKCKNCEKLRKEIKAYKETLEIISNEKTIKKLLQGLKDIKQGNYTIK